MFKLPLWVDPEVYFLHTHIGLNDFICGPSPCDGATVSLAGRYARDYYDHSAPVVIDGHPNWSPRSRGDDNRFPGSYKGPLIRSG